jgi:hypothetical protein
MVRPKFGAHHLYPWNLHNLFLTSSVSASALRFFNFVALGYQIKAQHILWPEGVQERGSSAETWGCQSIAVFFDVGRP